MDRRFQLPILSYLGCDFFRKYTDTQIPSYALEPQEPFFLDAGHCFQMVSNDYFLFFL